MIWTKILKRSQAPANCLLFVNFGVNIQGTISPGSDNGVGPGPLGVTRFPPPPCYVKRMLFLGRCTVVRKREVNVPTFNRRPYGVISSKTVSRTL